MKGNLLDDGKTNGTSVSTISECVTICPCYIVKTNLIGQLFRTVLAWARIEVLKKNVHRTESSKDEIVIQGILKPEIEIFV